jgi:hypothetical protein
MQSRLPYRTGATLLVVMLAACKSVGVVGYPAEYIDTHGPTHVWVTGTDNSVQDLYNPQIHGDTLVGFQKGNGGYVEMALSDVKLMKAEFAAPMRTALLAATVAVGTALVISRIQGTSPTNLCFPPGGGNMGLPLPCPKPA